MTLLADSLKRKWGVRILKKVKISLWKMQCFRLLYTCVFWLIIVRFGQIKHFWKWFNLFYSKMHNYLLLFHSEKMSGCCYNNLTTLMITYTPYTTSRDLSLFIMNNTSANALTQSSTAHTTCNFVTYKTLHENCVSYLRIMQMKW